MRPPFAVWLLGGMVVVRGTQEYSGLGYLAAYSLGRGVGFIEAPSP